MSDMRNYTRGNKRQLINYDYILGKAGTNVFLCIDRGFLEICKALAVTRGLWKSTYTKTLGETFYITPSDTEMVAIDNIVAEGILAMASCNDIENALESIALAISAQGSGGCGCGAGGAGPTSPAPSSEETDPPTLPGGTPPGGYGDWDEYLGRKCDVAEWIVDNMEADLIWLQGVTIGALAVSGLGLGIVSVLSGGTLTAMVALGVGVGGLAAGGVEQIKDAVQANKDLLRCALFEGTSAPDSIANFNSAIDTAIDAEIADVVARYVLKEFAHLWADTSQVNLMYSDLTDLSPPIPAGSGCADCYNEFQLVAKDPFAIQSDILAVYDSMSETWSITIDVSTSGSLRYWNFWLISGNGSSCDDDFTMANCSLDNFAINTSPGVEGSYNPCPSGSQQFINVTDKAAMEAALNGMGLVKNFDIRMATDFVLTYTIS